MQELNGPLGDPSPTHVLVLTRRRLVDVLLLPDQRERLFGSARSLRECESLRIRGECDVVVVPVRQISSAAFLSVDMYDEA